jgi:hypothetical protein
MSIPLNRCTIGSSYKLDDQNHVDSDLFDSLLVKCLINNESVVPQIGYKFGKFLQKIIHNKSGYEEHDEYYNVTINYEFEFGTIIDCEYPNRIEEVHRLPHMTLY